ncbi:MAG: hypothetical protein GF417_10150 [Candidatus Latescibacteria bacterium]|nr:hypothetical protein [bacterium]MBD3424788.1 hypothetical protein [Candidatus Latescibacterota bacterium]
MILRELNTNSAGNATRFFRMAVMSIILAGSLLTGTSALCQEDISGVMERSVRMVGSFVEDPSRVPEADMEVRISELDSVLSSAGRLSEYQVWTLKYIQAYLYYIRGIATGEAADFAVAAKLFREVSLSGESGLDPAKKDFAAYMVAWCGIRSYHSGGEAAGLDRALEILDRPDSRGLEYQRRFLRGYAVLARAKEALDSLMPSGEGYRAASEAEEIFAGLKLREAVGKAAHFYHLYSRWLKARLARAYHFMKSEDQPGSGQLPAGIPALERMTMEQLDSEFAKIREYAEQVAAKLEGTPAAGQARYLADLSLLQRAAGRVNQWIDKNRGELARLNQEQLAGRFNLFGGLDIDRLEGGRSDIIIASRALIANLPAGGAGGLTGEARLWSDLSAMNGYLQKDKNKFFSGSRLLENLPAGLFRSSPRSVNGGGIDSVLSHRRHLRRAYCDILSAEQPGRAIPDRPEYRWLELLSRMMPLADKGSRSGKRFPSESNLEFLLSRYSAACSSEECRKAGSAAMTMANCIPRLSSSQERKRRILYTAAYMLFRVAGDRMPAPGDEAEAELSLLRAFSLINSAPLGDTDGNGSPDNRDALDRVLEEILAGDRIDHWPARYRNEARYYRAVMERQVRGRFLDRSREELSRISSVDPRAAYIIGYQAREGADHNLLARSACLTEAADGMNWMLPLLREAGWEKKAAGAECSGPEIGPLCVRYDMLRAGESEGNFTRGLILDQLERSLELWSACVQPPTLLHPWSVKMQNRDRLRGPAEFAYLRDDVRVNIEVAGAALSDINLTVMSDLNTVIYQGPVRKLMGLRSGKRYIFVFSGRGFLPSVAERVFRVSGETIEVRMNPAYLDYAGECSMEEVAGGNPVFLYGDRQVKIGPAGVRYFLDGAERIARPSPGNPLRNISEFAVCGERVFAFDNNNREVLEISSEEGPGRILDLGSYGLTPSDIASDGDLLYISDGDRGLIIIYHPERKIFTERMETGINPALIAVCGMDRRTVITAWDPDRGLMINQGGRAGFVPASGLEAAVNDGMKVPFRLSALSDRGVIICRNNFFDRKLFLFLPTGGYAGSIKIPEEVPSPYYFARYSGPFLKLGIPGGVATCRMRIDAEYQYRITGPVSRPDEIIIHEGGWFSCLE